MIYFIADTHFGDRDIIDCCHRPFSGLIEHNDTLVANWNKTAKDDDEIYLLGDVGSTRFISQLNGIKYLVRGNHDTLDEEEYIKAGFKKVYDHPIILDDWYILSHKPLEYLSPFGPYVNIFGHVHNSATSVELNSYCRCVCVERIDYRPISFDYVKRELHDYLMKVYAGDRKQF